MTDTEAVIFALSLATLIGVSVWLVVCGQWDDDEIRDPPRTLTDLRRLK